MRAALGVVSLLVVLAVVALLTRKSLPPPGGTPVLPSAAAPLVRTPVQTPAEAQQVQEQYRQALDAALQQARPASDGY